MLLAFIITLYVTQRFLWRKTASTREVWAKVSALTILASLALSFLSICSVWTPYISNMSVHDGEFNGLLPFSKLSYPMYLTVYHTPLNLRLFDGGSLSGNASFRILLTDFKVMEVRGSFGYAAIYGRSHLVYSLDFPAFNNGLVFFLFMLALFTVQNIIGTVLGILLAHTCSSQERAKGSPRDTVSLPMTEGGKEHQMASHPQDT
jgi:hypothetical protein